MDCVDFSKISWRLAHCTTYSFEGPMEPILKVLYSIKNLLGVFGSSCDENYQAQKLRPVYKSLRGNFRTNIRARCRTAIF